MTASVVKDKQAKTGEKKALAERSGGSFLLGTIQKHEPPPLPLDSDPLDTRIMRYALQSVARVLIPGSRTAWCSRRIIETQVGVHKSTLSSRARYGGLLMCCKIWNCPVCAVRITEQRKNELEAGVARLKLTGGDTLLLTVTLRHANKDDLGMLLGQLQDTMQRLKRGQPWQKFKARHGIVGGVYSLEVTWGAATGWHPHRHELLMLDHVPDGKEIVAMTDWLKIRYLKFLAKAGGNATWEHGLSLDQDTVAGYVAKFGHDPAWLADKKQLQWTQVHEVTKSPAKTGKRSDRLTPFGMLRVVLESGQIITYEESKEGLELLHPVARKWKEYANMFHGKRQLVWWRGTKALLGIEEVSDAEIVGDLDEYAPLAYITRRGWGRVLHLDARLAVLHAAERGPSALAAYCKQYKIEIEKIYQE